MLMCAAQRRRNLCNSSSPFLVNLLLPLCPSSWKQAGLCTCNLRTQLLDSFALPCILQAKRRSCLAVACAVLQSCSVVHCSFPNHGNLHQCTCSHMVHPHVSHLCRSKAPGTLPDGICRKYLWCLLQIIGICCMQLLWSAVGLQQQCLSLLSCSQLLHAFAAACLQLLTLQTHQRLLLPQECHHAALELKQELSCSAACCALACQQRAS